MKWSAQAPANIALIKYMGKTNNRSNIPCNASLSYTLDHLTTTVELEITNEPQDRWEPLIISKAAPLELSAKAQQRFLKHLSWLKQKLQFNQHFIVRSANNFPANAGLASSASSFAALTKCAVQAITEITGSPLISIEQQAQYSRHGSGSSCRSFFSPWALWQNDRVLPVEFPYHHLLHMVVVVEKEAKTVSSSLAHELVSHSLLFNNRPQRAEQRLNQLINSLQQQDWQHAYKLCWQEFWDMHALFETAPSPFGYMTADTISSLSYLRGLWEKNQDGPLVTLDAGPNIHLLFRPDQLSLAKESATYFTQQYSVITSY